MKTVSSSNRGSHSTRRSKNKRGFKLDPIHTERNDSENKLVTPNKTGDDEYGNIRLPGLPIKGQGDQYTVLSSGAPSLRRRRTIAYALSPKLVNQLGISEKLKLK